MSISQIFAIAIAWIITELVGIMVGFVIGCDHAKRKRKK